MKVANTWNTVRRVGTLIAAAVVASIAIATPMMAAGRDQQTAEQNITPGPLAIDAGQADEQAREAGLTDAEAAVLQEWVDKLIAETGGVQIAANRVLWPDGSGATTIPLPGEMRARNLGIDATGPYGCPYYNFCTFEGYRYTGKRYDHFYCREYTIPVRDRQSWENNQTPGTQAWLHTTHLGWRATPGAYSRNRGSRKLFLSDRVLPCGRP